MTFKGTPGKRMLWTSIVSILVLIAAAYLLLVPPR
jgi:hypothetical protein